MHRLPDDPRASGRNTPILPTAPCVITALAAAFIATIAGMAALRAWRHCGRAVA